jgi:myo-inositol-1(or 4)-monophosphatase
VSEPPAGNLEEEAFPAVGGVDTGELLAVARNQALTAGALLLESFRDGGAHQIDSKSTPTDLVSEADHLAERVIREGLAARRPHDGFLGEESGGEDGGSGLRWVVDPLDGTVNFLFGIPQWCVSIAVEDAHGTLAGVVYDPLRGDLFSAVRGGKPTVETFTRADPAHGEPTVETRGRADPAHGEPTVETLGRADPAHGKPLPGPRETHTLEASDCAELATAMIATGFAYDARVRAAQAQVVARAVPRVRDIRRFGSAALDLAWTAAGRYDAYFERTVKPWDIAAGTLLCEAAGLRVLELPVHEDLPWGILVAPRGLCEPLLELVGGPA